MALSLVLADDSYLMREGIAALLGENDDIQLLATCNDADQLLAAVEVHSPDVVLTDIRMPPTLTDEGIQAALTIRQRWPDTGVVVLSNYVEPEYALRLFADGSAGLAYLLKERVGDLDHLARAIGEVAQGGSVIDPRVVDALVDARTSAPSVLERLTARETEVLAEIAKGRSNASIGEVLYISERAVEKHINSIFTKLDLPIEDATHRRVRAVLLYLSGPG
jgi:DNA-binding NarL/FixJ family response regulator